MGVRRVTGRSHSPPVLLSALLGLACTMLLVAPPSARADEQDSRVTDTAIQATDGWTSSGGDGFKIAWNITDNGSDYTYRYTITNDQDGTHSSNLNLAKGLSHIILQVTEGSFTGSGFRVSPDGTTWTDLSPPTPEWFKTTDTGNDNPNLPRDIYGIKLGLNSWTTAVIEFTSPNQPVWGDFYAKDGSDGQGQDRVWVTAWDKAFGKAPGDTGYSESLKIRTPDGRRQEIPEPATVALLVPMVAPLGLLARRRTRT